MTAADVNLTDTEREALIGAYQDGLLNTDGNNTDLAQLGIVVEQIVADRVAAALTPIQELDLIRRFEGHLNADEVAALDVALAAGVDAAPAGPPSTPDEAKTGAGVCWRSECRTGCYYPDVCSLKGAAAGVDAAPNETTTKDGCGKCVRCLARRRDAGDERAAWALTVMVVCPSCGNKRCPAAGSCDYECTRSNEPGQTPTRRAAVPSGHEQEGP